MTQRQIGILQIIASGACFGFLGLFGKSAYEHSILPGELLSLRFLLSALMIFIFLTIQKGRAWYPTKKEILSAISMGVFGYAVFSSCFFIALSGISASLTVLLLYTYPILVTAISPLLGEKISKKGYLALLMSSIGLVALVSGEWEISKKTYLFLGFASALFYAFYILASRKFLRNTAPLSSTLFVQAGAGAILALIHFSDIDRPLLLIQNHWDLFLGMSFLCSFLAMSLFLAGLQKISPAEVSILSTSEPLFGVLIAVFILNESLSSPQILGAILVLAAVLLVAFREPMRHAKTESV